MNLEEQTKNVTVNSINLSVMNFKIDFFSVSSLTFAVATDVQANILYLFLEK